MMVPAVALICLVTAAIACSVNPRLLLLATVGALDVVWLLSNRPLEGPVLLTFTEHHGLTVADLAVLVTAPAAWSYLMMWRVRRHSGRTTDADGVPDQRMDLRGP